MITNLLQDLCLDVILPVYAGLLLFFYYSLPLFSPAPGASASLPPTKYSTIVIAGQNLAHTKHIVTPKIFRLAT